MFRPVREYRPVKIISSDKGSLIRDLMIVKDDLAFADGVLVCQGEEILCHRVLLGARSDVFKKMFLQKDFLEGKAFCHCSKSLELCNFTALLSFSYIFIESQF